MPTSRKDDDDAPTSWKRNKRAADELPTNSKKSKIISNCGGETTESLISGLLVLPFFMHVFSMTVRSLTDVLYHVSR